MVKAIAEACGIEVCAKKDSYHTFFSSPYQAHRDHAAVDICAGKIFGCDAYSPVSGEVTKIRSYESPALSGKGLPEHLIIIQRGKYSARIMHIEPKVKEGDKIAVGDVVGRTITNGFFSYWVDPIMHVEVRRADDYVRARGGYELTPADAKVPPGVCGKELEGIVEETSSHNVLVRLKKPCSVKVGDVHARPDGTTNLDYSGVYGSFAPGETVSLGEKKIGEIIKQGKHLSTYKTTPTTIRANGLPFAGISWSNDPLALRLLPEKYGPSSLKPGEKLKIKID